MTKPSEGNPIYVELENMTAADIRWNVERLRNEAKATLKHAEALKRYGETKLSNGEVQNDQK